MNKPKQRQPHADFIIMQANDMSLRFDKLIDGEWVLVEEVPCKFYGTSLYRLHEREFPKTSLSAASLHNTAYNSSSNEEYILIVANAAIRQYILDTEKESK